MLNQFYIVNVLLKIANQIKDVVETLIISENHTLTCIEEINIFPVNVK